MKGILRKAICIFLLLLTGTNLLSAQSTQVRISGNVKDDKGEPLPYTTVRIKDTATGCTTDYNGNFSFNGYVNGQTLIVSSIGYEDYVLEMTSRTTFPLKIVLKSAAYELQEVVIKPGKERYVKKGNPAVELATEIIKRRSEDNPFNNDYVSRERYETFVIALDNFTEEKQQKAMFRKFPFLTDYVDTSLVSGKPILNVSTRELAATDYYQRRPSREKQKVHGREWIGIEDFLPDEEVRASVEATLRDVDLFNEKVMIMRNEFVSPFADYATTYYKFYLLDTMMVDEEKCVDLAFVPRNLQSFGFTGHLFITVDSTHFVKWIQMNVPYDINLNFVEYMNLEQKFSRDSEHPRLLTYESITAELKLYDFIDGIYGRREVFYSDYKFNDDVDREPFTHQEHVIESPDALQKDDQFWVQYRDRGDTITGGGKANDVNEMISKLRKVPVYYWTEQFFNLLFSGFVPIKEERTPFYIGPINTICSYNGLENVRFKLGGMTTAYLNPHLFGTGYLIYGLGDNRFKYYGRLEYSFEPKREQWNEFPVHSLRLQYEDDIYQYGQQYLYTNKDNALLSWKRLPDNMIGYVRTTELTYTQERHSGFTFTGILRNRVNEATKFIPMERNDGSGSVKEIMQTELELGLRYAPHEKFVQHKWNRKSKTPEFPVFTLNHTMAYKGLGSDYSIQHTELSYRQRLMAAPVGYFDVMLRAGKIWGQAPYPLLIIPNANLSYTYRKETFETMTPMEFVMDQHLTWDVVYYMNGLIFNRTPLIKHLKLREVLYCRGTWGSLSDYNNPTIDTSGEIFLYPTDRSKATGTTMTVPFVELGAGVENIFKLMSINWFRRMTYRNSPDVDQWGIRIAVHLQY